MRTSSTHRQRERNLPVSSRSLLLADAHDYQDRARTPAQTNGSVVHAKSDAFDVPPRVLEG